MALQSSTQTVTNLGTTTLNIQNTDVYNLNVTLQIPNIVPSATQGAGGGAGTGTGGGTQVASQVVATVNHNGSPIGASTAGMKGVTVNGISCTAGDTLTVVLTSSLSQDQQPNAIQATIALSES
jgi:hypothetical protein